jgi:hypothetical protein
VEDEPPESHFLLEWHIESGAPPNMSMQPTGVSLNVIGEDWRLGRLSPGG